MLPEFVTTLADLFESYRKWVSQNPQFVGDIETSIKWASYFIAGRMNSSAIISELIYSLSNLLVLFNDRIITKSFSTVKLSGDSKSRLKLLLTTLEYCEVFIELSAKQLWGESGRWFFIFVVQVFKCIGRLLLTYKYSEPVVQSPPIKQLDRKRSEEQIKNSNAELNNSEYLCGGQSNSSPFTFKLKRSHKIVRKVDGAPPIHLRSWKPLSSENVDFVLQTDVKSIPLAESLYIFKPMIHLGGISLFGFNSWKSYALALLLDFASLHLYYKNREDLSKPQKLEAAKRCVSMLLYLMRSPFYEKLSKNKIEKILGAIGRNVPGTHMVCNPLLSYIPHWQSTYFYMWST